MVRVALLTATISQRPLKAGKINRARSGSPRAHPIAEASEDASRQVRGKVEAEFTDLGGQTLKNFARPLHVYRVGSSSTLAVVHPS